MQRLRLTIFGSSLWQSSHRSRPPQLRPQNGGVRVGGKKADPAIGRIDKLETLSNDLLDLPLIFLPEAAVLGPKSRGTPATEMDALYF